MSCLFCKIIDKEIPAEVVYDDGEILAFRDINPQAPTHLLIIPHKHIPTINDIQDEDAALTGKLSIVAAKLAEEFGFAEDGYRTVMNCNKHSGQTVYHIHLHLLGGKPMGWPPYQETLKTAID